MAKMNIIEIAKQRKLFLRYMLKLAFRCLVLLVVLACYVTGHLETVADFKLMGPVTVIHVVWLCFMVAMLSSFIPGKDITMGVRKRQAHTYRAPEKGYDRLELLEYVQRMNRRAWHVMLLWVVANGIIGALYLAFDFIGNSEMLLLTTFYYVCDYICVLIFCPFQKFMMHNHCCVSCRIYDWGYFMMFTPMIFVRSFFSWSLFFMSLVLLIRWELYYAKYPERFWRGSNAAIRCENCTDRICRIKKPISDAVEVQLNRIGVKDNVER